jgi:hypothetical protein
MVVDSERFELLNSYYTILFFIFTDKEFNSKINQLNINEEIIYQFGYSLRVILMVSPSS